MPSGMYRRMSNTTTANINVLYSGQKRKNSSKGKRIKTAPTGPYMVTMPPNIAHMTTVKDMDTSKVDGPAILMKWA